MSFFSIDVEADGPIPGDYSMISFGAVMIDKEGKLDKTFYTELKPISQKWIPEALSVSGFTRDQCITFRNPLDVMLEFKDWILKTNIGQPRMIADNAGFDWMFMCWYLNHYTQSNPFGFSCTSLTSLYKGIAGDYYASFKHLRKTKHTHNALDDAKGNAEAILAIIKQHNFKMKI